LVASSLYRVVSVGDTTRDPLAFTTAPSSVTEVAPEDVHVNVDVCPLSIVDGVAVSDAVGIDGVGDVEVSETVTVARAVTLVSPPLMPLPSLVATR
jgi:hypothetical protein